SSPTAASVAGSWACSSQRGSGRPASAPATRSATSAAAELGQATSGPVGIRPAATETPAPSGMAGGRGAQTRTGDLRLPKAARYRLRHAPAAASIAPSRRGPRASGAGPGRRDRPTVHTSPSVDLLDLVIVLLIA